MLRFVVRRILLVVPALFGLLVLTFILVRIVPSDPSAALAGENATPEQIEQIREQYGFNRPLYEQFVIYLGQVLRGDLGSSVYSNRPVADDIAQRLPATWSSPSRLCCWPPGSASRSGVLAAISHNSALDHALRIVYRGRAGDRLVLVRDHAAMLFSMELDWLPLRGRLGVAVDAPPDITGFYLIDSLLSGEFGTFWRCTPPHRRSRRSRCRSAPWRPSRGSPAVGVLDTLQTRLRAVRDRGRLSALDRHRRLCAAQLAGGDGHPDRPAVRRADQSVRS